MKPGLLGTPERDLGWAEIRPLAENLIQELERQAKKIQALEKGRLPAAPQASPGLAEARRLLARLSLRTGDAVTLERQRVLHRAVDETYFRVKMAADSVVYGAPAATANNVDARVMRFTNAGGFANIVVPIRELWVGTRPRMTLFYTSPAGSTANFDLGFTLFPFGEGGTTTATTLAVTWSTPGPAVANDILKSSVVITASRFPSSPSGVLRCRLERSAADANAGDLDVLLALITFEEVA